MTTDDNSPSRLGSGVDLSRRMERMENRQDTFDAKLNEMSTIVSRVEANQLTSDKINDLHFKALESALKVLGDQLGGFIRRVEGLITGEVQLPQQKAMMDDWAAWRKEVDVDREAAATFQTQGKLLARIAVLLVSTNIIGVVVAIAAAIAAVSK